MLPYYVRFYPKSGHRARVAQFSCSDVFGVGSIIGMVALSVVIAVPISLTARSLTRVNTGVQAAVGLATLAIGVVVIGETFPGILGA